MSEAFAKGRGIAFLLVAAIALGVVTALKPEFGALFVLAVVFAGVFFITSRPLLPVVTLGILLVIPLDFIGPFAEDLRAVPVFGVALAGAVLSLLAPQRPLGALARSSWDVVAFGAGLVLAFSINGTAGGVRQAVMLVAGMLYYFWIRASHEPGQGLRREFLRMLLYVGIVQGLATVIERFLGAPTFASLVPGYEPAIKDFTLALGARAAALAGHPLRLGALEMSALIAGIGLSRGTHGRDRMLATFSIAICSMGLLLSGARGAWLGVLVGVISLLVITPAAESHKIAFRLGIVSVASWFVLEASGVLAVAQDRLFGAAARPASLAQRVGVLASTVEIWGERPVLGYGYGTYLEEIYAAGFRFSNTENEYVNFVLSGGIVSLAGVAIMGVRGVVLVWRSRYTALVPTMGGLLVAWLVIIGTFNAFSWSAAFPLFMSMLAVIADGADE